MTNDKGKPANLPEQVHQGGGRCWDCMHYSDGECYKLFEAISVHCACEGPIDGVRVDKDFCCKFYASYTSNK